MKYWSFLLIVFGVLISSHSFAAWIHGGDIKWEHLGNDSFKFTVTVYRDCNGIRLSSSPLSLSTNCGIIRATNPDITYTDITPTCASVANKCVSSTTSFNQGIQEVKMEYYASLASFRQNGCCSVNLSWTQSNRSPAITTGGASSRFFIDASMNFCGSVRKVDWIREPQTMICLGKDVFINSFSIATDSMADSIHYSWAEPLRSHSQRMAWSSPYSYDKSIYFLGFPKTAKKIPQGLHLDERTGQVFLRPVKEEVTVLKVRAEMYRNGIWQGTVDREQTVIVHKCANDYPLLSSYDCTFKPAIDYQSSDYEKDICAGDSTFFAICATDSDTDDVLSISFEHDIPGLKVRLDSGTTLNQRPKLLVSWFTHDSMIRKAPYVLTVRVKDDNCPIIGEDLKRYALFVKPKANVALDIDMQSCGTVQFTAVEKEKSSINFAYPHFPSSNAKMLRRSSGTYSDTTWHQFSQPGVQKFTFSTYGQGLCLYQYEDSILVLDNFPRFSKLNDTLTACSGDSLQHFPTLLNMNGPSTFIWEYNGDTLGQDSSITIHFSDTAYEIRGKMIQQGCETKKQISVLPHASPKIALSKVLYACQQDSIHKVLNLSSKAFSDSILEINWTDSLMNPVKSDSAYLLTKSTGRHQLALKTQDNCWLYDTLVIRALNTNVVVLGDSTACKNTEHSLKAVSTSNGQYEWYLGNSSKGFKRLPGGSDRIYFYPEQGDTVKIVYKKSRNSTYCHSTKFFPLFLKPRPFFKTDVPDSLCQGDSVLLTSRYPSTWKFPHKTVFGDSVWYVAKNAKPINSLYYTFLSGTGQFGCSKDSQFYVYHHPKPSARFSLPDSAIKNTAFYPASASTLGKELIYLWQVGTPAFLTYTDYEPNITIDSQGVFDISLLTTNTETGCSDFTMQTIEVLDPKSTPENPITGPWSIYPNPAKNTLYLYRKQPGQAEWSLSTLKGQVVKQGNTTSSFTSIAVDDLAEGLYVLRLVDGMHSQVLISIVND